MLFTSLPAIKHIKRMGITIAISNITDTPYSK